MAKNPVTELSISADFAGQRIDNFLMTKWKGVPKNHIYRLLRKGEVRVNKKRVAAFYRLNAGDLLRLPPIELPARGVSAPPSSQTIALLLERILYEDDDLIVLNKPANMSVHAGSTVRMGVIEALKHHYKKHPQLELAHRLDSETSGCLIIAKKRRALRELHSLLREGGVLKVYWALTKGQWQQRESQVSAPLHKHFRHGGQHLVEVNPDGKASLTTFETKEQYVDAALVEATLATGRTHQIRVHATHMGHPIAGDLRYGEPEFNKKARGLGLKRMFLHARVVEFTLPSRGQRIRVVAPLDQELKIVLKAFQRSNNEV